MSKKNIRRRKRKTIKPTAKNLRFLGVNAGGLQSKLLTLKKVLLELQPAVFFIEETKYKSEGKLKLENYEIFELTRKTKEGGGLAIGCINSLSPVWVREGNENSEALSIEIFVNKFKIRCCAAYGPQETDRIEKKNQFWDYLYEEVSIAKTQDLYSFYILMKICGLKNQLSLATQGPKTKMARFFKSSLRIIQT